MTLINEYYNEIRNDIAKEFGFEKAGIVRKPSKDFLTIRQYQKINEKYPYIYFNSRFDNMPNPMAIKIIKRYNAIALANLKKGNK